MTTVTPPIAAIPAHVVQAAQAALAAYAAPLSGLDVALIVTPDGFEIASLRHKDINLVKLSAMTSSLVAMARAVGRELNFSGCRRLVFDMELGSVIAQPVAGGFPCLICMVVNPNSVLGSALWALGEIATAMSAAAPV